MNASPFDTWCSGCGRARDDPRAHTPSTPCPFCGDARRTVSAHALDGIVVRDKYGMKARHQGDKRPFYEAIGGADFHRLSGRWMHLSRVIDRENDKYTEIVTDPETGEVVHHCDEPLSIHQGHGDARRSAAA